MKSLGNLIHILSCTISRSSAHLEFSSQFICSIQTRFIFENGSLVTRKHNGSSKHRPIHDRWKLQISHLAEVLIFGKSFYYSFSIVENIENSSVLASLDLKCCVQFKFGSVVKNPPAGETRDSVSIPGLGREWLPILVFLPGKSRGQRSLASYRPWGHEQLGPTEQLNTHTHSIKLLIVHITYYKGKGEKGNVWNSPYFLWNIPEKFTFISPLTSFPLKFFKMGWLTLGNTRLPRWLWG